MSARIFIGIDPKDVADGDGEGFPIFSAQQHIPLGWFTLFKPNNVVRRIDVYPDQLLPDDDLMSVTDVTDWQNEPLAFKTTVREAANHIHAYKVAFKKMPYIWSYFRIIDILQKYLDEALNPVETLNTQDLWQKKGKKNPQGKVTSQVRVDRQKHVSDVFQEFAGDQESSEIDDLEALARAFETPEPSTDQSMDAANILGALAAGDFTTLEQDTTLENNEKDAELQDFLGDTAFDYSELSEALESDKRAEHDEISLENVEIHGDKPVIVSFENILAKNQESGKRYEEILIFFDRLLQHVMREERRTRVILEILQDVFRGSGANWRLTGQLAEDFIRQDISLLPNIMLGTPSPFMIFSHTFDLEYWTNYTLQNGDERIMYRLSILPSEELHLAIESGKIAAIASQAGKLLGASRELKHGRISPELLEHPPIESNLWGLRILTMENNKMLVGSILNTDPNISWKEFFEKNLELPSVMRDWNITLDLRLSDYTDVDSFNLEFKGAASIEEAFKHFVRWVRRHQLLYFNKYGADGTIAMLSQTILGSNDNMVVMQLFDILSSLTEYGFDKATEVLANEQLIEKLTMLT